MGKPEAKKPEGAPAPQVQKAAPAGVGGKVGCHAVGCKSNPWKHEFCEEHFKQFKFGLITKKGELVSDYERKFEHYQKWLRAQKVA